MVPRLGQLNKLAQHPFVILLNFQRCCAGKEHFVVRTLVMLSRLVKFFASVQASDRREDVIIVGFSQPSLTQ